MFILEVMSCIEYGGTETFVYNSCKQILKEQNDCEIGLFICGTHINKQREAEFKSLGIEIFYSCVPSVKNYSVIKKKLREIDSQKSIDVIHCHMNLGNVTVLHAAKQIGIPKRIAHSHDTAGYSHNRIRYMEQLIRRNIMIHDATDLLACATDAGTYLFGKVFAKKGKVIPNGIETEKIYSIDLNKLNALKQEYQLEGKYVIGNISRFDEKKNHKFIVQVFEELTKKYDNMVLVLGGVDAGLEEKIRKTVNEKNLNEKVRFIGPRRDMNDWLELLDIWVMPSLFEGLPFSLVEAQFHGLLCIVSNTVSKEVDLGYGLVEFLPLNDLEEWVNVVSGKYENKENDIRGKNYILNEKSRFNIKNSAMELFEIYQNQ